MKYLLLVLVAAVGISGCGPTDHQRMDSLEREVATLRSTVNALKSDLDHKSDEIDELKDEVDQLLDDTDEPDDTPTAPASHRGRQPPRLGAAADRQHERAVRYRVDRQ
jgi:outer membrane murein-binding lipoprotein Lpp